MPKRRQVTRQKPFLPLMITYYGTQKIRTASELQPFEFESTTYYPNANGHWKPKYPEGMHQLAVKFRRQHPVGPYIAGFYCAERSLVVEVEGNSHFSDSKKIKVKR